MSLDILFLQSDYNIAISSVLIGAGISSIFWILKERKLDPEKWKKNSKRDTILLQIAAYGKLLIFLDSAEKRRKNYDGEVLEVTEDSTHLFLFPGHDKQFNQLFRENLHLCSENIRKLHNEILEKDTTYLFSEKIWPKNQTSWVQAFDFSEIHSEIKKEYDKLKNDYEKLTGYSID